MKADWAAKSNEPRAAAEMYLSAGETMKVSSLTLTSLSTMIEKQKPGYLGFF